MILKPIDQIKKSDIEALIANAVREGRGIDYKRELPGTTDDDRREFLADISSFANASGGYLIIGVDEEEGLPTEAKGLANVDADAECLRIENMVRDGIKERMPGFRIQVVDGFQDGPVLVLRLPKSWAGPHMVTFKNLSRFFTRNNMGKDQMDITEIRAAFALSEEMPERIRRFRDDRLAKIIANDTPVPLQPNAKVILHLLPLVSFSVDFRLDPGTMNAHREKLQPIDGSANRWRFNLDGLLTYNIAHSPECRDYCQMFRTGAIEAVDAHLFPESAPGPIPTLVVEMSLIASVRGYLEALDQMEVPPPVIVMVTLVGVKGYDLAVSHRHARVLLLERTSIDRDELILPEVQIDDFACDVAAALRPIFDAVWNAAGWDRCRTYDASGQRNPDG